MKVNSEQYGADEPDSRYLREYERRKYQRRLQSAPLADDTYELVQRWRVLQDRRGLSNATINKRRNALLILAGFMYPRSILEATEEDIEVLLDGRDIGPKARYAYISDFSMFFKAMMRDGLVATNPTEHILRPRQRVGLPRPIPDDDLYYAIKTAEPTIAAALTLAAYQGLRAGEIAHLQRDDILDSNDPPILHVVQGKGGKDRVLPLHPEVMPALRRAGMPKYGRVLRRQRGGAYSPDDMSRAVNVHLHDCGIDATLHQARHWFGTKTYQQSRDIRLVQALLGHSSPTTTAVYAQASPEGAEPTVFSLKVKSPARPDTHPLPSRAAIRDDLRHGGHEESGATGDD